MISDTDLDTLTDNIYHLVTEHIPSIPNQPFGVSRLKLMLQHRLKVPQEIINDSSAAAFIEKTMNDITALSKTFPQIGTASPDEDGNPQWIYRKEG